MVVSGSPVGVGTLLDVGVGEGLALVVGEGVEVGLGLLNAAHVND